MTSTKKIPDCIEIILSVLLSGKGGRRGDKRLCRCLLFIFNFNLKQRREKKWRENRALVMVIMLCVCDERTSKGVVVFVGGSNRCNVSACD